MRYFDQLKALWQAGESLSAIALEVGRTPNVVKADLAFIGELEKGAPVVITSHSHPRYDQPETPPEIKQARALKRAGLSCSEIAEKMGRLRPWVSRYTADIKGRDQRRHGRTRAMTYAEIRAESNARTRKTKAKQRAEERAAKTSTTPTTTTTKKAPQAQ
jgi:hypothetical protein